MIRGSFRGFVSGWAGMIMISIGLSIIICCFCCWCTSILYSRRSGKRRRDSSEDEEKDPSITMEESQNLTTFHPTSSNCIELETERDTAIDVSWSSTTGTGCVASPKSTTEAERDGNKS